jgi:predicted transcriptional regulator
MSNTVTVRLPAELVAWLDQTAMRSGVPRGRIIREQLEKARENSAEPTFMRLAGTVKGARDLSERKGFSRK